MPAYAQALKIVQHLVSSGHTAYFAGGWVRDYVMKHPSDDIDIATSASPAEILDLFPYTIAVGIQFGVVIVLIDGHPFEVATFRKDIEYIDGRKPAQIEQASPRVDALRRDFTINGMFYDPLEDKIHDYVGGMEDIERGVIRAIGNPFDRFFEDRLRMVRAFRFSARFDFHIEQETEQAILENAARLFPAVAMERIWQEFCKMAAYPHFDRALLGMHRLKLLQVIFPELDALPMHELERRVAPVKQYLKNTPQSFFLKELFPEISSEELFNLGKYLKLSNRDIEQLVFFAAHFPYDLTLSRVAGAEFYAHPDSEICLNAYAARLSSEEANRFFEKHEARREELSAHIDRIKNKTPLLTSKHLIECGIAPGVAMGKLLKEAFRLSIELNLNAKEEVLHQLKQTPLWSSCVK